MIGASQQEAGLVGQTAEPIETSTTGSAAPDLADVQHFVFEDASWSFYKRMLKEVGGRRVRLTYDGGRLEMMAPLRQHEGPRMSINRFVDLLAIEIAIPFRSYGLTTFKRRRIKKGLEPDACFYFKNQSKMDGRSEFSPKSDPPPDLAVEVDVTSRSIKREPIYAALGVPELWRWRKGVLDCLHLTGKAYVLQPMSLTFPFLRPADLGPFVELAETTNDLVASQTFLSWIRSNGWGPGTLKLAPD
jgi:Uma2 family endonuclease